MTDIQALAAELCSGNRRALSRAITLAESTRDDHRQQSAELLAAVHGKGKALRIGITGVPGVGKSTFIEGLGLHLIGQGHKVAVLAVDPSSTLRGGAILGDKTRMQALTQRSEAFIRPSPSGSTLGGVARRTFDAALLCEAAGYDIVLIETVGVGQSETTVASMTDVFMLLLLPGGGDDLQGIKRGIMELADLILVNKADGDSAKLANHTVADYRAALQFLPQKRPYWRCKIQAMSALTQTDSIAEAWQSVKKVIEAAKDAG
ncbi:MAG: methylmalonyl Co-A mutase-associated GTPase MeaB, partial [Gammaproteobacteria bacterium]|nr:methylmalonyl Co-A mutase-associated GTPase MeaB [Gammaproteobacteria bacterium]